MEEKELKEFENKEINRITKKVIEVLSNVKNLTDKQIKEIIQAELKSDPIYSGLQDWNIHYSKERIKEGVLSNKLLNQGEGGLSLSWFNFYVYFRLPAGIVISFLFLFFGGLTTLLNLIDIAIIGTLFWGLKERKFWAYKMNFIVLIAETILRPLERAQGLLEYIAFVIAAGLIWLLPNWIYFRKRRYLFSYSCWGKEDNKNNRKKWNINVKGKFTNLCNFIVKNKIVILIILVLVALFYWYGYRPSKIRHDCSWVKRHLDAIPAKTQEQYDECMASESNIENTFYGIFCDKPRYGQPAKDWWQKASKEEYEFCIHEKGLY